MYGEEVFYPNGGQYTPHKIQISLVYYHLR